MNKLWLEWVLFIFQYPLGSIQTPHFAYITDALLTGINDVLSGFNKPLQSPAVLDHKSPIVYQFVMFSMEQLNAKQGFASECFKNTQGKLTLNPCVLLEDLNNY